MSPSERQLDSPRVGVVTVTYNTGDTLREFLDSLPAAGTQALDVVVVDNASADAAKTRAIAEERGARFLALNENIGYGSGIDAGVAILAKSVEYILVANPDVVMGLGSIDELVAKAAEHPEAGAFGPRINEASGAVYPSARRLPSLRTGIGHVLFVKFWPTNPWTRSYRQEDARIEEREAGWLSGACQLIRASDFTAIGGFDESYFMYFEDVDLGARMARAGRANLYVPSAIVTHTGAHSTVHSAGAMDAAHHDSAYTYLSRKYTAWYLWPLRVALRLGLGFRKRWRAWRRG